MATYFDIPEGAEVWQIAGNRVYVVYKMPGTDIPLVWHVDSEEQMARIFGQQPRQFDRTLSQQDFNKIGALDQGKSAEIIGGVGHPWNQIVKQFEEDAELYPWMRDPEAMAAASAAAMENRDPQTAIMQTDYWRNQTQAQRDWAEFVAQDPATARQRIDSNKLRVRDALIDMGYKNPPDTLANYYAELFTHGQISDVQLQDALRRETDPYAAGASPFAGFYTPEGSQAVTKDGRFYLRIDGTDYLMTGRGQVARFGGGAVEADTLNEGGTLHDYFSSHSNRFTASLGGEERVRALVTRWLGPVYGDWSDEQIAEWAGKMRANPESEEELVGMLRNQFNAAYGQTYTDGSTYEDAATLWDSAWQQVMGQKADRKDPLFDEIVRTNDLATARRLMRQRGFDEGNGTVLDSLFASGFHSFGSGVREAAR